MQHLRFPVIVKPPRGYSSVGITVESRCTDAQSLRVQAGRLLGAGEGALIEEFIEGTRVLFVEGTRTLSMHTLLTGREVTVLVVEDPEAEGGVRACVPVECVFPVGQTFKHFDLKWKDWQGLTWQPLADNALAQQVRGC